MEKQNQKKKLCEIIIDNRFLISIIMILILTVLGFFRSKMQLKDWLFDTDKTLSLWSNIKLFTLFLSSYELFNIITNKKEKLSLAGAIVLAFSGFIIGNINKIDAIILGEIITVLIYKIIDKPKSKLNILKSITIIICSVAYMYTFRSFAISFGYLFFALVIGIILKNIKTLKENKGCIITLSLTLVASIGTAIIAEMFFGKLYLDTLKPNQSVGFSGLFTYIYTPLLPFNNSGDISKWLGIISVFPIPMLLALYYMYKKDEHSEFLLPITLISVFETIYCISGFPEIINKVTMLSEVSAIRVAPAVQMASLFIMFYFFSNVADINFNRIHTMRLTVVAICVLAFIQYPTQFLGKIFMYIFSAELSVLIFLFLNFSDKKYQKVLLFFLMTLSLIGGVSVLFM